MCHEELIKKIGNEVVYIENTWEDIAIKILPDHGGYLAKFKGGKEYKIESSSQVVCDALLESKEITEKEYNEY